MKRFARLMALMMLIMLAVSLTAGAEEDVSALREQQETMVLEAVQSLAKYGIDKCKESLLAKYFEKGSPAWQVISRFNKGFYPKLDVCKFSDLSAENWTMVSDEEFTVEAKCLVSMVYHTERIEQSHSCHYRFYVHRTAGGQWMIYDFDTMPSPEDAETAQRLSALRDDVHFEAVTGKTFRGFLITVDDLSQIYVGTCAWFGEKAHGLAADAMSEKYGAFAVINGGGFSDTMKGGDARGVVISQGEVRRKHNQYDKSFSAVVGITRGNRLAIGHYTVDELNALDLRDAVAFSPLLIADGQAVGEDKRDPHKEYTIRTIVAEDAEGRAVFLIVKGRQADSLGATTKNVTEFLLERGIVAAANMDGGTSTALYVNGESIYSGYRFRSSRPLPTAFIIGGKAQE